MKNKFIKRLAALTAAILLVSAVAIAAGDILTLEGAVEMTNDGLVLQSGGKVFFLDGEGLDSLAGKNARVTGELETAEDGGAVIVVESAEAIK